VEQRLTVEDAIKRDLGLASKIGATMNLENPYQPSQIAQFHETDAVVDYAWTPEDALGPKWMTICKGAANCHTAMAVFVVASISVLVIGLIEYAFAIELPSKLVTVLGLGLLYATLMQFVGLVRMRKLSRESGAKGFMTLALILFVIYLISSVAYSIATLAIQNFFQNARLDSTIPLTVSEATLKSYQTYVAISTFVMYLSYLIYNIILMLGIRRIGIALHNNAISRSVMKSLWLFVGCVIAIPLTTYFLAMSMAQPKPGAIQIGAGISAMIAIYIMLDFYAKALKKIAEYAKMFAPADPIA
jgi:hypothetical protein